jgi:hypothetical protein
MNVITAPLQPTQIKSVPFQLARYYRPLLQHLNSYFNNAYPKIHTYPSHQDLQKCVGPAGPFVTVFIVLEVIYVVCIPWFWPLEPVSVTGWSPPNKVEKIISTYSTLSELFSKKKISLSHGLIVIVFVLSVILVLLAWCLVCVLNVLWVETDGQSAVDVDCPAELVVLCVDIGVGHGVDVVD